MVEQEKDYYQILGVSRDADDDAIKKAYHKLAMKWHPDRNSSPEAESRFKEIATAYAILKDPKKRARYDAQGVSGVSHYSNEDLFGDLDLGDLFRHMQFDYSGGGIFDSLFGRHPQRPLHGEDLRASISVPLDIINTGGKQKVRVSHTVACDTCHGFGTKSGQPPPVCTACKGSGRQVVSRTETRDQQDVQIQQITVCPVCHGLGHYRADPCKTCAGYGKVEKEELLKLHIPAGTEDGTVLRVSGHGMPGETPNVPPGDLYVAVYTKSDARFQRRGADLWRVETISVADAVLGRRIKVATLSSKVDVKVPPGTQPGEVLRLRGQGLPKYHGIGNGDLNIHIQIRIPKKISAKERELYETLRSSGK